MNTFKEHVYQHFLGLLLDKITVLQQKMDDLRESLKNETKSTAGDKHETSRAMVHIEQENTGRQLAVLLQQKAELEDCSSVQVTNVVIRGSLVKTDRGYFYLAAGLGKACLNGATVFALSPVSPLGQKLSGCRIKDAAEINAIRYIIEDIR